MKPVLKLYQKGELTVREVAEILDISLRDALELIEGKAGGGNVSAEEQIKAIELAKRLSE